MGRYNGLWENVKAGGDQEKEEGRRYMLWMRRRDQAIIARCIAVWVDNSAQKVLALPLIYEVIPRDNAPIMCQLFLLPKFTLTLHGKCIHVLF